MPENKNTSHPHALSLKMLSHFLMTLIYFSRIIFGHARLEVAIILGKVACPFPRSETN